MSGIYQLVFAGDLVEGFEPEQVKASFMKMFKVKEDRVHQYFTGEPRVIKKNLDRKTASQYRAAFVKVGAEVRIKRSMSGYGQASAEQPAPQRKAKTPLSETQVDSIAAKAVESAVAAEKKIAAIKISKQTQVKSSKQAQINKKKTKRRKPKGPAMTFDPSVNAIEAGRLRQQVRMSQVEIVDQPANRTIGILGFVALGLGVADLTMFALGNGSLTGNVWPGILSAATGAVILAASRAK